MLDNEIMSYENIVSDIKSLITEGRKQAYGAANKAMIITYWNIGKRIVEQEQAGEKRAEYGPHLIAVLAEELTKDFGRAFFEKKSA